MRVEVNNKESIAITVAPTVQPMARHRPADMPPDNPLQRHFAAAVHREWPDAATGKRTGWQRIAAARIGISQTLVSQIYAGKKRIVDGATLVKLRAWMGVSIDEMLGLPELPGSDRERLRRLVDQLVDERLRATMAARETPGQGRAPR